MTEADIKGNLLALQGAVAHQDNNAAMEAGLALLGAFLITQTRIADALELLCKVQEGSE